MEKETWLDGLEDCPLSRETPFGMDNVSYGPLSIARHFGGCNFNGARYTYIPTTDELIRDDVLKWKRKSEKKDKAQAHNNK